MSDDLHAVARKIVDLLEAEGCWYETFQHVAVRTSEAEVSAVTGGVQPGGAPPFGNLFELPVYAAPELFDVEDIVFNAGDRRFSLAMRSADYRRLAARSSLRS